MATFDSRSARIEFHATPHEYFIDGVKYDCVSTLLEETFGKFHEDEVIEGMIRRGTFQRKYGNMTVDQVKAQWERTRSEASAHGTRLHAAAEKYMSGMRVDSEDVDLPEFLEFQRWYDALMRENDGLLLPYKCEFRIFDEPSRIAGTIDALFLWAEEKVERVDDPGHTTLWKLSDPESRPTILLYDWKFSREISDMSYGPSVAYADLPNSKLNVYSLQLALYAQILTRNYRVHVGPRFIVQIPPETICDTVRARCNVIPARNLDDFAKRIIETRIRRFNL